MVSQNVQLLELIELFVKWCQYSVLLEQLNSFLINKQTVLTFGKCLILASIFAFPKAWFSLAH